MTDSSHPNSPSLLQVEHLEKRFGGRPVIRDISIKLHRGEVVGLLGPNGAGKTTSFYLIAGLIKPDKGVVKMGDLEITNLPMYARARLGIGYLPQESSIFRSMTVADNIMAVLELVIPDDRDLRTQRLEQLLGEFSISYLKHTPAVALSGGERRRLEIARALASNPLFVLLDEPLAGIDPIAVGDIRTLIAHLKDRNIGVLITDHNVRETLGIVDRAYIIHNGLVLMEGTPAEVIADDDVRRVYLGEHYQS
jgi:lipopolysaccharide export system ATP-binding protein